MGSSAQRRTAGEAGSNALIAAAAAAMQAARASNQQPMPSQPPPVVQDVPINWLAASPFAIGQPTAVPPPKDWATNDFMPAFSTKGIEEEEEEQQLEEGRQLATELAKLDAAQQAVTTAAVALVHLGGSVPASKGWFPIFCVHGIDAAIAYTPPPLHPTHSPTAVIQLTGKPASDRLLGAKGGVQKVRPGPAPDQSPMTIERRGSNRLGSRYTHAHAGGIPRILPNTDQPVTTFAEKRKFEELLEQFQRPRGRGRGRVDWKGMRSAFNAAFYTQQEKLGQKGVPLTAADASSMLFTKSISQLKRYNAHLDKRVRVGENEAFSRAIADAPLPPLPQQGTAGQQSTLIAWVKQPGAPATTPGRKKRLLSPPCSPAEGGSPSSGRPEKVARGEGEGGSSLIERGLHWLGMGSQQHVAPTQPAAAATVQPLPGAIQPAASATAAKEEGTAAGASNAYMCAACLMMGKHACQKKEHPRGGCPISKKQAEGLDALKLTAMKKMLHKKMIVKAKAGDFNGRLYLEYLRK